MNFTNYMIESGVSLALFYLAYYLLLRREATFGMNRIYLIGTVVLSFLLPIWNFPFFQRGITNMAMISLSPVQISAGKLEINQKLTLFEISQAIYVIGLLFVLIKTHIQLIQILRLKAKSPCIKSGNLNLVYTKLNHPTFTFFNHVFVGKTDQYKPDELAIILEHEQAHVSRLHTIDLIITRLACAVQWFNPFIWLISKSIKEVHEFQADRITTNNTVTVKDYQYLLFNLSTSPKEYAITNSFHSILKKRIIMLHKQTTLSGIVKAMIFIPIASTLILFFACSTNAENEILESTPEEKQASASSNEEPLFHVVEEMPTFEGQGPNAFIQYVHTNLKYPKEAVSQNIGGKVMIQFVVNKDGYVERVEVTQSAHPLLDEEAVRVIENSPQWTPGKQRGQKVNVQFTIPVLFSPS